MVGRRSRAATERPVALWSAASGGKGVQRQDAKVKSRRGSGRAAMPSAASSDGLPDEPVLAVPARLPTKGRPGHGHAQSNSVKPGPTKSNVLPNEPISAVPAPSVPIEENPGPGRAKSNQLFFANGVRSPPQPQTLAEPARFLRSIRIHLRGGRGGALVIGNMPNRNRSLLPSRGVNFASVCLLVLWTFLCLLSVSPQLHRWFHADAQSPGHQCVAVQLQKHQALFTPAPAPCVEAAAPLVRRLPFPLAQEFASFDYRLSPSRAPPGV